MESPPAGAALAVGSAVRVAWRADPPAAVPGLRPRGGGRPAVASRAVVATAADDGGRVALVHDGLAPVPRGGAGTFRIAPPFAGARAAATECEAAAADVAPLLDFERDDEDGACNDETSDALIRKFKDYGDQLLRLKDYACAISYYEAALNCVSSDDQVRQVGATLVVRKGGHCVVTEVDCVEEDEKGQFQFDVTYPSGEEATITQNEILLAVHDATLIQPR